MGRAGKIDVETTAGEFGPVIGEFNQQFIHMNTFFAILKSNFFILF